MKDIEIVKFQVETAVSSLQSNILQYYYVLHELKRISLILMTETVCNRSDIDNWFRDEAFGICEDGFWQSLYALNKHRQGFLSEDAVSYSCHPDLRFEREACFQMYCHRNVGMYLSDIRSRLHDSAWIYYQSTCNIALQYPFIDQSTAITPDFDWSTYHTWISVSPENNPERQIRWTSPSIDYAGEGLIISVSIPVYQNGIFRGLWSIDLPIETLYRKYIYEKHIPEQQNFIADYEGNLIIHPIIKTKIDQRKGSIYREKLGSIGKGFEKLDLGILIAEKFGQTEVLLENRRKYEVFYKIIPEINWIYFSIFPKDRMLEVINDKVKSALDNFRNGDYSYRLINIPDYASNSALVKSFNEMAEAIEIQHQQILESQKRVVQAEKLSAIGTLAGGIAHDFNNVLSSIIGFTELALDETPPGTSLEDNLKEIYAAGKRAKDLIWQILAYARQSEEPLQPIQVSTIVKEVLKLIRSTIPTTIKIAHEIESDSLIMGNPTLIYQVIMNLCTNAAHAMDEKGGVMHVKLRDIHISRNPSPIGSILTPGAYIEISVSDNGIGIPPDIIDSIFEPYFTTKDPSKGTGMGLAVVQGIVEKFSGKIKVESSNQGGTVFYVYLPITHKRQIDQFYETDKPHTGRERILFVDDEGPIAKMGAKTLERLGYTVTTRTNSLEALELFRSKPNDFDLVITDMTMPNMTGDILAVNLIATKPDLPIILCTGYSNKISEESAAEMGIRALAYKPITNVDLAKTVRKVLDNAKPDS